MSISQKTRKKLWGLSASRCAISNCRKILFEDVSEVNDYILIGDEAHINSGQENGPRYSPEITENIINTYSNLILLCKEHHTVVDKDTKMYTTEILKHIKTNHENWVSTSLGLDKKKQEDDEIYAEIIDNIDQLAGFQDWEDWTAALPGGHLSRIKIHQYDNLVELHKYLCNRVYPKSNPILEKEIMAFNNVLEDFLNSFEFTKDETRLKGYYVTEQLYREGIITISRQYEIEYTIQELIYELTKQANRLCDIIRKEFISSYRRKEGILLMRGRPGDGISYIRLEYEESKSYPGLEMINKKINQYVKAHFRD